MADDLAIGVSVYENALQMPALRPGKYDLAFYVIVPFLHIAEQKNLSFAVEE